MRSVKFPVRAASPPVDILLVGTGAKFLPVPPALRQAVRAWGVAVEGMGTAAACRTYNVLLAEERRVAAALIALPAASLFASTRRKADELLLKCSEAYSDPQLRTEGMMMRAGLTQLSAFGSLADLDPRPRV